MKKMKCCEYSPRFGGFGREDEQDVGRRTGGLGDRQFGERFGKMRPNADSDKLSFPLTKLSLKSDCGRDLPFPRVEVT
jgi:hypothetical protein